MQGFQITFITEDNRKHGHVALAQWLLQTAKSLGIRGATCLAGYEGYGRDGRIHSEGFVELADRPVMVIMAVAPEQADALFALLEREKANVFYVRLPVELGVAGGIDS